MSSLARTAAVIVAGLALLLQGPPASTAPPGRTLAVTVKGLPDGAKAKVKVKGPGGYSRTVRLEDVKRLKNLTPGRYRLRAQPALGGAYRPVEARQKIRVRPGKGVRVVFRYRAEPVATDLTAPAPVTELRVTDRTATSLQLSWTSPGDAAGVIVRRATGPTPPASPADGVQVATNPGAVTALDSGLTPKTAYSYAVFARDAAGNVAGAGTVTATTLRIGAVAAGNGASCALNSKGRAYCWGSGPLGNSTATSTLTALPVDTSGVLAGRTLTAISGGGSTMCALDIEGRAYCWGAGGRGQLGNGTLADSRLPVAVSTDGLLAGKRLVDIAAGFQSVCAIDDAGRAYCWGEGANGRLGNGTTALAALPVAVSDVNASFVTIDATQEHVCATDTLGRGFCWGAGAFGRLGNGGLSDATTPIQVFANGALAGKRLVDIAAGNSHSCALDSDGRAYCWGAGSSGRLGTGLATDSPTPVAVSTSSVLFGVVLVDIDAGQGQSCAVTAAGRTSCWGFSGNGQVGDGTRNTALSPVLVTGGYFADKEVLEVDAGQFHTCGVERGGRVACWGAASNVGTGNSIGQDALVPVPILGIQQ